MPFNKNFCIFENIFNFKVNKMNKILTILFLATSLIMNSQEHFTGIRSEERRVGKEC